MRVLKAGECVLASLVSAMFWIAGSAMAEGTAEAKPEWTRICQASLNKEKTNEIVYRCGKNTFTEDVNSNVIRAILADKIFFPKCSAYKHLWPFDKISYSCAA